MASPRLLAWILMVAWASPADAQNAAVRVQFQRMMADASARVGADHRIHDVAYFPDPRTLDLAFCGYVSPDARIGRRFIWTATDRQIRLRSEGSDPDFEMRWDEFCVRAVPMPRD